MKWLKEYWIWLFIVFVLASYVGLAWISKENGDYQAWVKKPLSQATIGDATGMLFMAALFHGLIRK